MVLFQNAQRRIKDKWELVKFTQDGKIPFCSLNVASCLLG